jgi:hypothetical protein
MGIPPLRRWATRKARQAYHHGFIQDLAHDPKATVLTIVNNEAGSCPDATTKIEHRGQSKIQAREDAEATPAPHSGS